MNRYRHFIHLGTFFLIVLFVIKTDLSLFFIEDMDTWSLSMPVSKIEDDSLYKEIKEKSSQFEEKPQDAYIDRVWKKTPGRNGLKVDLLKSYQNMEKSSGEFDETLLVFEEISPETSLKDLPASPIFRGHPEKEMVALLINVSWGTEYIPDILNILKENNVKATFFIEGKWAKENVDYVKMIHEQGHVIGNHAYNHPDMARLSNEENRKQMKQTNDILHGITGQTPIYFAPPSGSYTQQVVEVAHELDMETIMWTVDTIDWKNPSVSVMLNRVLTKVHPGATILMHPTSSVASGLDQLIKELKQKKLQIGTIEELLDEDR